MKRFHEELPLLERRARVAARFGLKIGAPLGAFRKRTLHDCGKARCMLCHGEKLMQVGEARNKREAWRYEMSAGGVD